MSSFPADCPAPHAVVRRPGFALPVGACDTHAHVISDDVATYPFVSDRSYTPPPAPESAYLAVLDGLGLTRGVLVQPSIYGTDNRYMLDVLSRHGERLRGVAVVDPATIGADALTAMDRAGVRGVRINVLFRGGIGLEQIEALAQHVAHLGWHIQLLIDLTKVLDILPYLGRLSCPVVVDHMGRVPVVPHPDAQAADAQAADALERMAVEYGWWVKLSGAYRLVSDLSEIGHVAPLARRLVAARPDRMLWGSDWPHVAVREMPDTSTLLDLLAEWVPDVVIRNHILVENPARLYGFGSATV